MGFCIRLVPVTDCPDKCSLRVTKKAIVL